VEILIVAHVTAVPYWSKKDRRSRLQGNMRQYRL